MTYYNELLSIFTPSDTNEYGQHSMPFPDVMYNSLHSIVELHKPDEETSVCWCADIYPCPTIKAIEKELT